ncbi:MAG: polysaccharide deacetylase family protein [Bacteroidota bacterium]|nr:polysaccharide deacetylase family protein [Bacteroidota bacterium]
MLIRALIFVSVIYGFCFLAGCKTRTAEPGTEGNPYLHFEFNSGAIVRGDTCQKKLAMVFTGDEFADGGEHILSVLKRQQIYGSFFLTGNFYKNPGLENLIRSLISEDHYLGAHSDKHLLYCDWGNRDSLLLTRKEFVHDLENNYAVMKQFGILKKNSLYFLPPYEWYNDTISLWTISLGLQLINFTHGTLSHADYTTPDMPSYISSELIYQSIIDFETESTIGLNGFILLSHIGTAPERDDKFYYRLEDLIKELKTRGYQFQRIDELLDQ